MKRVRRERTNGEDAVCKMLWSIGARYRRNVKSLPGTPDVANQGSAEGSVRPWLLLASSQRLSTRAGAAPK